MVTVCAGYFYIYTPSFRKLRWNLLAVKQKSPQEQQHELDLEILHEDLIKSHIFRASRRPMHRKKRANAGECPLNFVEVDWLHCIQWLLYNIRTHEVAYALKEMVKEWLAWQAIANPSH